MRRKIITVTLALVGISIIGLAILQFLGLFKKQQAGILIESVPNATVFLNGLELGRTPYEAEANPVEITLRIKPDQIEGQVLDDYETKVTLVSGIKTIIKREFNKSEDYSSGVVTSFEKSSIEDAYVSVVSVPDNAQISIDGQIYGYTPKRIKIAAGDHELKVTSDNYIERILQIKVYRGFNLTASVKLAKNGELVSTVTPAPVIDTKLKIKIDKNSVGFLRVRSGANTGFPEIGQVKPEEIYDVLEEGEHGKWYKIKFINSDASEVEGWVNAEFVTKL